MKLSIKVNNGLRDVCMQYGPVEITQNKIPVDILG